DVDELMPFVGAVQRGGLIEVGIHRHHSAQEEDHILSGITPYGCGCQGNIVDAFILQPHGDILQIHAEDLKDGVQDIASCVEKLKDKSYRDSADQIGEEHTSFENRGSLYLKDHQCGKE